MNKYNDERIPQTGTHSQPDGFGLIIVILVMAFLMTMGIAMITITSTGTRVADNVQSQRQAFNAAEAGFDAAWVGLNNYFSNQTWTNFGGHTLTEPAGIDLPSSTNYFRKLTDIEIFSLLDSAGDGTADYANVLLFKQLFVKNTSGTYDSRFTYTAFLIDDEAAGGASDSSDALLVCIGTFGTGEEMTTSRIEVELEFGN